MTFGAAISSVLTQYTGFSGRARRSEYWYFVLFNVLVSIVAGVIDTALNSPVLAIIVGLGLLLPSLAVTFRRLHDTGRSAWWILIGLIPLVGGIVLLVFQCQDSEPGANRFGPSPKGGLSGDPYAQQSPAPSTWS